MIEIKNKYTGKVILAVDETTLTGADLSGADLTDADLSDATLSGANLSRADLSGADLSGAKLPGAGLYLADLSGADLTDADLSGANLTGANLFGANLCSCTGNSKEIRTIQTEFWLVSFSKKDMAIGCEQYPIDDWRKFKDSRIALMDLRALGFWKKYKEFIFQAIKLARAGD